MGQQSKFDVDTVRVYISGKADREEPRCKDFSWSSVSCFTTVQEHVTHREYVVAFRKVVDTSLKLKDKVKANKKLLENTVQELHKLEKKLEVVQAKTKNLVATLDEKKTLFKKSHQVGFGLSRMVLR